MDSENVNNNEDFSKLIYLIRGVKVMLDADLATIYGYETRSFNQQVKNNIEKFDYDFRFQLTKEEYQDILRSKNLTSKTLPTNCVTDDSGKTEVLTSKNLISKPEKRGGRQHLPYVFTEQGIYMLMTVLKGDLAIEQSKALIRTFKRMKDYIVENRYLIGNNELAQLSLQTAQNTANIAEIKNTMVTKTDLAKVVRDFTDSMTRREYLILNGESVEANLAYSTIYKSAKNSVFVVDNYIGLKTLVLLKNVAEGIPITVFSDNTGKGLHQADMMISTGSIRTYKSVSIKLVASFMTDTSSSTMQLVMNGYFTAVHRQKMPETK